ncbi:S8 family serine peptidase [Methylobacterium nigriterrae]|uniref:S8 family serine peptidase n=1 Tax=Methylobacterium nigriterrae TaxID=3127512 RepID=UPI003013B9EF
MREPFDPGPRGPFRPHHAAAALLLLLAACPGSSPPAAAQGRIGSGYERGAPSPGAGPGGRGDGLGFGLPGLPGVLGLIPRLSVPVPGGAEDVDETEPPRRRAAPPLQAGPPRTAPRPRPQRPEPRIAAPKRPEPHIAAPKRPEPHIAAPKRPAVPAKAAQQPAPPPPKPVKAVKAAPPPPPVRRPPLPAPTPPPARAVAAAAEEPGTVPGEVLLTLRGDAPERALPAILRREGLVLVSSDRFALVPETIHRVRIRDGRGVESVVSALGRDPQVASAQANHAYALVQDGSAPMFAAAQYAPGKLRLAQAHHVATGRDVTVAVIDSRVDQAHPALQGAIARSYDALAGGDAETAERPPHAHGTAIAGILAARSQLSSAAPEARLIAVQAFSSETGPGAQGTTLHILRGIDWAATAGARVVNMSFAGPRDAALARFLAAGARQGAIYVAAAGNAGAEAAPLFPAADPNVIAVTATDADDRLFPAASRGAHLCVAAPGVEILVAAPNGAYGFSSGTSLAAAEVSGIVALMLQARPGLAPAEIRAGLSRSARDLGPPGPDAEFGSGFADAEGAVRAVFEPDRVGASRPQGGDGMAAPVRTAAPARP